MTPDDIAEGRALGDHATPGPWAVQSATEGDWEHGYHHYVEGVCPQDASPTAASWVFRFDDDYGSDQAADAELIVWMRNNLAELLVLAELALAESAHKAG